MRGIKPLVALSGALVLSMSLFGCQGEKASEGGSTTPSANGGSGKKLVIGFSQIGAESAWRTAETESVKAEAAKLGVDLKFADAQQKQENQIKAVRNFVAQGVDAIMLAPVIESGWDAVLLEAKKAKIPVILLDRGVKVSDDSLYTTLIGSDFVNEGRLAGEWLAKKLNGKGNVVELLGTPGSAPANERHKGFMDAIAKTPGIQIIKSQTGEFTRAKGKEVMEAFLKSPDSASINALYAHNDDMAIGAIEAIKAAGRKPGTDIVVVSVDSIRDAFKAIKAGELNCTVECNPLLGPQAFQAAKDALAGKKLEKKTVVPDVVYDTKPTDQFINDRKY